MKIISWNVNGIRAAQKKGIIPWIAKVSPDILCLQETKAHPDQLTQDLKEIDGYTSYFSSAEKKGYSGVAVYTKKNPDSVDHGFGEKRFDSEGRIICARYAGFTLYNIYYPNGKASPERLKYKMEFYDAFLAHAQKRRKNGERIVVCGDVNTAHTEIDLARPKENEDSSGFLPEERAWIDKLIAAGYIDTFRLFEKGPDHYTWWDLKTRARERNIGWRIDYFFVSEELKASVKKAFIMPDVEGSDHCPIGVEIEV
ncbi:MAG: exodeoxyribonuclease III [Spirochaetota bacterium]|mgnify:CR=1 FL=1